MKRSLSRFSGVGQVVGVGSASGWSRNSRRRCLLLAWMKPQTIAAPTGKNLHCHQVVDRMRQRYAESLSFCIKHDYL